MALQEGDLRDERAKWIKGTKPGPGRPRNSSRLAKLRKFADEICKEADLPFSDPVEALFWIGATGKDPLEKKIRKDAGGQGLKIPWLDPVFKNDGSKTVVAEYVPLDIRIMCFRLAAPYMAHKLSSVQLTGEDGSPLFNEDRDRARVLSQSPEIRKLMEEITKQNAELIKEEEDV